MRYLIEQSVRLAFGAPVREHHCELRLAPRDDSTQRRLSVDVTLDPEGGVHAYVDYFGNQVHACDVLAPHDSLLVRVRAEVETLLENPFGFALMTADHERRWLQEKLRQQPRLWDYVLHRSRLTPEPGGLRELGLDLPAFDGSMRCLDAVLRLRDWVAESITYAPAETDTPGDCGPRPSNSLTRAIEEGAGEAADLAHLLLVAVRGAGYPARYVEGYRDPDGEEGLDDVGAHSWVEVLVPGAGWRGFDSTAGLVTNDRYLAVRAGRDAADAPMLRSSARGADPEAEPQLTARLQRQRAQQQ